LLVFTRGRDLSTCPCFVLLAKSYLSKVMNVPFSSFSSFSSIPATGRTTYHTYPSSLTYPPSWTQRDEQLLIQIKSSGKISYEKISSKTFHGKFSGDEVRKKWTEMKKFAKNENLRKGGQVKGPWNPSDDEMLIKARSQVGEDDWNKVAAYFQGKRSGKFNIYPHSNIQSSKFSLVIRHRSKIRSNQLTFFPCPF
jgi:hypothetical protein